MDSSQTFDRWPLVELDVRHNSPELSAQIVFDVLQEATRRRQPFAGLIKMPNVTRPPKPVGGVGQFFWMLKELRPQIRRYCRGVAFVVSTDTQTLYVKSIGTAGRLWGIPMLGTDDLIEAEAWVHAHLEPTL